MKETDEGLKREIGLWGLSANFINIMVGAGIFVLPAIVAAKLGASSILAYLFCGVLVYLVMLCFAEVGSKVTIAGGPYAYIEYAFGNYAGFLTINLFVLAAITSDAAVANALGDIISIGFPVFKSTWVRVPFFLMLFSGLAYINVIGIKSGIRLVKFNTIIKLVPLLLLILIGWKDVKITNLYWETNPSLKNIGEMVFLLIFAFQGIESGLTINGEVKNPHKTIPKAILFSLFGILMLYMLIQTTAQGVLGANLPEFPESPLAEVASRIIGPVGFTLITIGAAVSMFGTLSGEVLAMPRAIYGAARDNVVPPKVLATIHRKYATPHIAIMVYAGLGFILASSGGFKQLAILSSTFILLIYLGVAFSLIKLRLKNEVVKDTFKLPGGNFIALAAILIIIWLLSNLSIPELIGSAIFIGFLNVVYFAKRYLERKIAVKGQTKK